MKCKYESRLLTLAYLFTICIAGLAACAKEDMYNDVISNDQTKPDPVSDLKVINFKGGAHIIYRLPKSGNILYVQASYKINGTAARQAKSSYYSDTITVSGFAESKDYEVSLRVVSRANIMSDEVIITVHPDIPVYKEVLPTVVMTPDFGGVNIRALNISRQPLGVILVLEDPVTKKYEIMDQFYTKQDTIDYSVRGYDTTAKKFGVYITDQWGNISDTVEKVLSPIFETQLDKNKFSVVRMPTDAVIGYGWNLPNLWDGKQDGTGWHTLPGGTFPLVATWGLGVSAKLSRFTIWQRLGEYTYSHGNPRDFSLWGSDKANPVDQQLPVDAAEGTVVGDWVNMGNYHYPDPPSGARPGAATATDIVFAAAGVGFQVPLASPKVKYLRFAVASTWSGGDFAHFMEITIWGNPN